VDKNLGDDDDDKDKEYIELHALKIYLFDPMTQEFDLQYECLTDVNNGLLDNESVGFTNDSILCNDIHTFFWRKEKNVPKQEGFYVDCKAKEITVKGKDRKEVKKDNDYVF
jgi:hypothetical protein